MSRYTPAYAALIGFTITAGAAALWWYQRNNPDTEPTETTG